MATRQISKSFGTYEFPETCIIQHGQIVRKIVGGIAWMSDDTSSRYADARRVYSAGQTDDPQMELQHSRAESLTLGGTS